MNYFAHGRRFVDDPYFLAGTATPDWLNVVDRRMRVRAKAATPFVQDADAEMARLARGVVQHHFDDDWFHQTRAFAELSLGFSVTIREHLPRDEGFRPAFLGHILVELLLDAALIEQDVTALDAYYAALAALEPAIVESAINRMATKTSDRIRLLIPRFLQERFLYDYLEDAKLLARVGAVLHRVGLPPLPASFIELLPAMRDAVRARQRELLQSPERS
jgi:hypothetical protein